MYIVYHVTGTLSLNECTLKPHLSGFDGKKVLERQNSNIPCESNFTDFYGNQREKRLKHLH